MTMNINENTAVGAIVADNYRSAEVFEKFGIDFCCKGQTTLAEVCKKENLSSSEVLAKLNEVMTAPDAAAHDYKSWPADLLADYIEKTHHHYVREKLPLIMQYLDKVVNAHGNHNPEVIEIRDLFAGAVEMLTVHMQKEEMILFPFVRKIVKAVNAETPFGSVESPIRVMMHEHEVEGDRFRTIASLSNNYTPPDYACNTYKVSYALLKEFEADLHLHIHLENNILFPKALELEQRAFA